MNMKVPALNVLNQITIANILKCKLIDNRYRRKTAKGQRPIYIVVGWNFQSLHCCFLHKKIIHFEVIEKGKIMLNIFKF